VARDAWCAATSAVVEGVVEDVFEQVGQVHDLLVASHGAAAARGESLSDSDVGALAPALRRLLDRPRQLAVGLGVILEPGLLPTHPLRIEWWQRESARSEPTSLEVDLHPDSLNFYDYADTEWFAVPRSTRRRHIVGPYVDVHGTDSYLLTLTVPVEVDGSFLGVAGADVPMSRFETVVLGRLAEAGDTVVVNDEGRVVVSTTSRWLTGSLSEDDGFWPSTPMAQLPWRIMRPL
jgi:hypothetical protein